MSRALLWAAALLTCAPLAASPDADVLAARVGISPPADARLPAAARLVDSDGRTLSFGDLLGARPLVLMFGYYRCATLCSTDLDSLARALLAAGLRGGRDVEVAFVGIDPREGPALARRMHADYARAFADAGAEQWRFLTAERTEIRQLTEAAGFRYLFDAERDQYAHAAGVYVLTPSGRIARVLPGVRPDPAQLAAAVRAAAGDTVVRAGPTPLLMLCFAYDPASGRYSLRVMRVIQMLGAAMLAAMAAAAWHLHRRNAGRAP